MATPLCPYFKMCNGCTCQHIDYSIQLENKKNVLKHAIEDAVPISVHSDKEYFYRNRMDFLFFENGIGFRQREPTKRVDVEECVIANETINLLLKELKNFFKAPIDAFDNKKKVGTFRYAVIRAPQNTNEESSISFVLNSASAQIKQALEEIKEFAKQTTAKNILITYVIPEEEESISSDYVIIKGKDMLEQEILNKRFNYSVQGFFQNNTMMTEKMQQYVHEILCKYKTKDAFLLDLYAGVGTFGIINAELFKYVTIIEGFQGGIDAAKINIEKNNITNATALCLDATHLRRIKLNKPLYVITDPPRSGMDMKTIQQLIELQPEVIIYISCNVQQLGKDVKKFKKYEIKSAALFDLFPQTNHSEAVVELVKKR
jgi:23S rRNA (uracil-5-)-methyltransferase RumA